jgi:flagellum-specific ATP synthase
MNKVTRRDKLKQKLLKKISAIDVNQDIEFSGTITRISGVKIEAIGISVPLGTLCKIIVSSTNIVHAEVIGFADHITYLMATENINGIMQGTPVIPLLNAQTAKVGKGLLGRVLDAQGDPIDTGKPLNTTETYSMIPKSINPLERKRIAEPLDVGIRAINGLLTVGKGQRLGIFAGSGVGKSILLGMMTRFTHADVVVVGLIGERSREVKEFIEENLGQNGLSKSVVVVSPADTSPLMRVNGAALATTIAEYYRDKGKDVLLIVDSLTRYAQAQREISLAVGEMPATKGFTPSVFAKLAQLVERSGNGIENQGSITAFYTVLVEGDEQSDPIADHMRSLLDGHIFLSRHFADRGHYPAIDIEKSISRVMPSVVSDKQLENANHFKKIYATYMQNRDLINVGMYQHGTDKVVDEAIKNKDQLEKFLCQGINEPAGMMESVNQLKNIFVQ